MPNPDSTNVIATPASTRHVVTCVSLVFTLFFRRHADTLHMPNVSSSELSITKEIVTHQKTEEKSAPSASSVGRERCENCSFGSLHSRTLVDRRCCISKEHWKKCPANPAATAQELPGRTWNQELKYEYEDDVSPRFCFLSIRTLIECSQCMETAGRTSRDCSASRLKRRNTRSISREGRNWSRFGKQSLQLSQESGQRHACTSISGRMSLCTRSRSKSAKSESQSSRTPFTLLKSLRKRESEPSPMPLLITPLRRSRRCHLPC